MADKEKLFKFDREEWKMFLHDMKEGTFDHPVAQALLEEVNSETYWVDAARSTSFASEQTIIMFEKWLVLIGNGVIESPRSNLSTPEKLAELIAASPSELHKKSLILFNSLIESENKVFIEGACLEYCRRLVRMGEFDKAVDATILVGEVVGEWSKKYAPYFERLPFWQMLAEHRFEDAFDEHAMRFQTEEAPLLVKFKFAEPVEDVLEHAIYEVAVAAKPATFNLEYAIALGRLSEELSKRDQPNHVDEVNVEFKRVLEQAPKSVDEAPETLFENLVEKLVEFGPHATTFVLNEISDYAAEHEFDEWYEQAREAC